MYRFVHNLLHMKMCICIDIVLEREAICNELVIIPVLAV